MAVIVENLTKQFAGQTVVDHLSFSLHKGEVTGFLGLNGAGKTTTMKMMTGALEPDQGSVSVLGYSILTQREQAQKHIGYLPEHNPLYTDMYVKEYLSYVADIYKAPKRRIEESIALTQLESHAHKKIHTLSKGYRQRIGLASTLLHDPDVLILDEPTNGLDPQHTPDNPRLRAGKGGAALLPYHAGDTGCMPACANPSSGENNPQRAYDSPTGQGTDCGGTL